MKTIFKPTRKIQEVLRSAKDKRDPLATPGVYRIPCSYGKVYIGTTKRSIGTTVKEHKASCRLGQTTKSAVAEHTLLQKDHEIKFEDSKVLARIKNYYPRMYREAIEIHKHVNNLNRTEETMKINKICLPVLRKAK